MSPERRFYPLRVVDKVKVPGGKTKTKPFYVLAFDGVPVKDHRGNYAHWSFDYREVDAICYRMEEVLQEAEEKENDM